MADFKEKVGDVVGKVLSSLRVDVIWKLVGGVLIGGSLRAVAKVLRLAADLLDKKAESQPQEIPQDAEGLTLLIADMIRKAGEEATAAILREAEEKAKELNAVLDSPKE